MHEEKKHLVPRLRFPEFRDAGPWEVKRLGEVCEVLDNMRRPVNSTNRKSGPYPYYGASGVIDYIDEYIFDERLLLIGEDGAKWGPFERTAFIVEGKYWVNNHAHVLRSVGISDVLLENYLNAVDISCYITGAAPPKLTLEKLKSIRIPAPKQREEQQKIADCLSSLDEVIELQAKKLEALKAHKRGLMQQLFPREGETTPRLRFPEFRNAGPWEVKRLGEVATISMGSSPPSSTYNTEGHGLPLLQGMADVEDKVSRPRVFTTLVTKACKPGDILLSVRAPVGAVAKAIHNACIGRGWAAIRGKNGTIQQFLYQYLLSLEGAWARISQGGTFDSVTREDVASFPVALGDLFEQQKIADCLSSLDEVIELQAKKLEALKAHKKGLMQQLFPQEVTP